MKRVEIRPIEKVTWHGKKGDESIKRPIKIQPLVNSDTMEYETGLTEEEAETLGKRLKVDLSPQYDKDNAHPFWDSGMAYTKLENRTMFLSPDLPLEAVKLKYIKKHKNVANSMAEYEKGLWPDATHVIYDENEGVEKKATKGALRMKATIEASKLNDTKKIQLILILNGKNLKGNSPDFITAELDELLMEKPSEVLDYIQMSPKEMELEALILEALQKSVLRKVGHKVLYHDDVLGGDTKDVVDYFKKDENQDLLLRIKSAIN